MICNRPYLIRAFYEWITDSECTPHIVVSASNDELIIPRQYVKDGKIVLNISHIAVKNLVIDNDGISFSARFGGVLQKVYTPISTVMAIYADENGKGAVFAEEDSDGKPPPGIESTSTSSTTGRRHLTLVKNDE